MSKSYYDVMEIDEGIYHIFDPAMVFCTLVVGEEKALLLDTGYGLGDLRSVVEAITHLPTILLNSHGHVDHVGGNWQFDSSYIHKEDMDLARRHSSREMRKHILKYLSEQKLPPAFTESYKFPEGFSSPEFIERGAGELIPVEEGQVFPLGNRSLEVVAIKGHTRGGIGLVDNKTGLLLAGDAINPFLWIFDEDSTQISALIDSLEKLKGKEFHKIIISHSPEALPREFIDKLIACAKNIDIRKSVPFYSALVDKQGLLYSEGGEPFVGKDFIGIVFSPDKL